MIDSRILKELNEALKVYRDQSITLEEMQALIKEAKARNETFGEALLRVKAAALLKYQVKEPTLVQHWDDLDAELRDRRCPKCKSTQLAYVNGVLSCMDCDHQVKGDE